MSSHKPRQLLLGNMIDAFTHLRQRNRFGLEADDTCVNVVIVNLSDLLGISFGDGGNHVLLLYGC